MNDKYGTPLNLGDKVASHHTGEWLYGVVVLFDFDNNTVSVAFEDVEYDSNEYELVYPGDLIVCTEPNDKRYEVPVIMSISARSENQAKDEANRIYRFGEHYICNH